MLLSKFGLYASVNRKHSNSNYDNWKPRGVNSYNGVFVHFNYYFYDRIQYNIITNRNKSFFIFFIITRTSITSNNYNNHLSLSSNNEKFRIAYYYYFLTYSNIIVKNHTCIERILPAKLILIVTKICTQFCVNKTYWKVIDMKPSGHAC